MMTTGLLALAMVGVKLAATAALVEMCGRAYYYDHEERTLYLDAGLTLQEAGHVCEEILDAIVNRLLAVPIQQERRPAG